MNLPTILILLIIMLTHSLQSIANGNIIFIPKGAEWSYSDNGINLGKDWKEPDFDDSAWKKGETVIGFGNNNITTIAERGGVDARNITFYFRKEFNFSSKLNDSFSKIGKELSLRLGILRDDGAVIYLNGEEIARDNMPEGEINSTTLASSSVVGTGESTYHEKNINPKFELKLGKNVIAVEVHQITSGSGDLGFDLHLDGIINEKINGFTIESLESRHKGSAIDSNNRFLIIGAPQSPMNDFTVNFTDGSSYDTWELGTGEVQIYKKLNSIWVKHSTITSSNADRNDFFGYSVAIHNDTIVVGAPYEDGNLNEPGNSMNWQDSGAAYVFKLVNNTWVQTAYLKADNSGKNDHFGFSVDISNDQIIIGAPFEDSSINNPIDDSSYDSGAAYIFSLKDNNWTQDSFLKSFNSDANDNFGYSVSISNRLAIIGAPREDGDGKSSSNNSNQDSGAVYIFERNNNIPEPIIISEISPKKTLVPTSDLGLSWTNRDYDDSNWIEVLNTNEEGNSGGIGFAWSNIDRDDVFDPFIANDLEEQMYRKNQTAYLRIPFNIKEKKTYQNLDLNVRTDDGFIAYINGKLVQSFKAPEKPNWESGATSANPDSIAIQLINFDLDAHVNKLLDGDNVLAIHAMNFGINGSDFLFSCELKSDFSNSKWLRKAYLKASNPDPNDMFGRSIATDGSTLVVGAPLEDSDGTNEKNNSSTDSGAVYVFEFLGFQWEQTQYIKSTIVQELSLFGNHLDLSGNYIAISEPNRISVNSEILFGTNHPKKILLPNQDIGLEWTSNINYDDSQWISSIGGIGFERETDRLSKRSYLGLYDLDLSRAMFDNFNPLTTVYVRIPFLIKDKTDISSLMMFMQSDDGYIVYLNGVEIHRFNAPTNPNWRSASTTWHADEEVTDGKIISLDQHIDKLLQGENLLAIHAMNSDGTNSNTGVSSDFLMNCLLSTNLKPRDRGQISIYSNQNFEWKINKIFNSNSEKGILLGSGIAMNRNELVASTPREPGIESIANNISALIYENQEGSWNEIDSLGDGINSTISLSSFSGKSYSIQVSHDFDEWIDIESNIKGTGFEIIKNYTLPGNSQFFRITEKTDPIIKE